MRLCPLAQGEQVRVLRYQVVRLVLGLLEVRGERGGGEGGVQEGEGSDQRFVLQGAVQGLGSVWVFV